jgi:hypothetical protein
MLIDASKYWYRIPILKELHEEVFDIMTNWQWNEYLRSRTGYRNSTGIEILSN